MKNFKKNLFVAFLMSLLIILPAVALAQDPGVTGNPNKGGVTGNPNNGGVTSNPNNGVTGNPNNPSGVTTNGKIENPLKNKNINTVDSFIKVILEGVIKISIPIIALAIIYSGFLFVSARGNTEKLGKAKQALLYTCIGAAILLGSWAIAQVISNTVLAL